MEGRRLIRHAVLAVLATGLTLACYSMMPGATPMSNWSIATAWVSLLLLAITLMIGPYNVIVGKHNPISGYLRRDVAIWGGILALIHMMLGLQVHFAGKVWLYFLYPADQQHLIPFRYGPFGITNYLGVIATLMVLYLLYLSRNTVLKRYGVQKWKRHQKLTYFYATAVVVHGFVYQYLEKRSLVFVVLCIVMVLAAAILQWQGYRRSKAALRLVH